jgi:predicted NAD-dependent protein-ADP-ribosyltransferase YbiA (DUF1768 family)
MDSLAAALAAAPRRYRMPPLPADAASARAAGIDVALAFAIESARTADVPGARELFVESLAAFIDEALQPHTGDPAFQALLVRANEPTVREYVALQAREAQDARAVRRLVDAVAHPAKLARLGDAQASRLAELHPLAKEGRWAALRELAESVIEELGAHPSLQRLAQGAALRTTGAVARYCKLVAAQGPLAGSDAAAQHGRDAARAGKAAEAQTVAALQQIADTLHARGAATLRVARGLKTPRGFPGERAKAKDEWDVALLETGAIAARIVLLGEVKASPASAPADFSRLHRGLMRLARSDAGEAYAFASADGPVTISGESLRALAPLDYALPKQVVYFCIAPAGQVPPPLSAASKAVLAAEPASIAFALQRDRSALEPLWASLRSEPRLRATLHQYDTARRVCEAMLHPQDLLDAFRVVA